MQKALFLDRDGTINVEVNYLYKPEDFRLIPGIMELAQAAKASGYLLVVCTNQSGIARGYFTEADYRRLTDHMRAMFAAAGCTLDGVYHCPELSGTRRKPEPGMFLEAAQDLDIDMAASLSLGDKERDVCAARSAGVGRNFLLSPHPLPADSRATAAVTDPRQLIPLLTSTSADTDPN